MKDTETPDPKRPEELMCGCVVTRSTGEYKVLCDDHLHLQRDPAMRDFAADAERRPRVG